MFSDAFLLALRQGKQDLIAIGEVLVQRANRKSGPLGQVVGSDGTLALSSKI
jgi:hypothetical protein